MSRLANDRHEAFCQEYLVDGCQTQAAVRAGYSQTRAGQTGYELMQRVEVLERIVELQRLRSERLMYTQDDVLQEIALITKSSIRDFEIDGDGHVLLAEGVPPHMMRAVSSLRRRVTFTKKGERVVETEIRLWDKVGALRLAAQHLGMLTERHDVRHTGEVRYLPPVIKQPEDADGGPDA